MYMMLLFWIFLWYSIAKYKPALFTEGYLAKVDCGIWVRRKTDVKLPISFYKHILPVEVMMKTLQIQFILHPLKTWALMKLPTWWWGWYGLSMYGCHRSGLLVLIDDAIFFFFFFFLNWKNFGKVSYRKTMIATILLKQQRGFSQPKLDNSWLNRWVTDRKPNKHAFHMVKR